MSDASLVAAQSANQKYSSGQMSPEQFAKKIKAKYPVYASMPDAELVQKVLDKYPQYHSVIKGEKLNQPQGVQAKFPSGSQQEVHNKAEYLPAVGATVGGMLGAGAMSIPGAALGGAAGEAAKQLLNRAAGEGAPDTSKEAAKDIGKAGAEYGAIEGGGFALGHGIGAIATAVKNAKSPLESVAASRLITKAVNPVIREWPEYMKATQEQAGNILKFAEDHGIKINTQRDWAQVSRQAADEAADTFKVKYVEPVAKQEVTVMPNYHGHTTDPHRAMVGDIYKRIVKINEELRPSYMQTEAGITQARLANEGDLLAEKESLTRQLESAIEKGTGAKPEEIAAVRRRTAQLYTIADHTEAAANVRASSAGKMAEGRSMATSKSGITDRVIEHLRGGREHIADKQLTKTLKRTQTPVTELSIPPGAAEDAGAGARDAARAGRATARESVPLTTTEAIKTDAGEITSLQRNLAQRISKNNAAKAAAKEQTSSHATARAGRIAEREAIPSSQSSAKTTEDAEIDALRTQLAERIKRNDAAKTALSQSSGQTANRAAARKMMSPGQQ